MKTANYFNNGSSVYHSNSYKKLYAAILILKIQLTRVVFILPNHECKQLTRSRDLCWKIPDIVENNVFDCPEP